MRANHRPACPTWADPAVDWSGSQWRFLSDPAKESAYVENGDKCRNSYRFNLLTDFLLFCRRRHKNNNNMRQLDLRWPFRSEDTRIQSSLTIDLMILCNSKENYHHQLLLAAGFTFTLPVCFSGCSPGQSVRWTSVFLMKPPSCLLVELPLPPRL